ncbi:MAG: hypothetical protein JWO38_1566 [Gemmataceae bacterium]|nr:hypothetical protein [Gemmataceae bacterium]
MAIVFNCPHCNHLYRLPDALAGKRATCKNADCRKVIVIPQPRPATVPPSIAELGGIVPESNGKDHTPTPKIPTDVEAAALAALSDTPKEEATAAAGQAIPVTCPHCGHQWTEPAAKAGKNTLCPNPECRQRIKVPLPKKAEPPQDWRQGNIAGPTLAKQNFEQPEDVMNAEAKIVGKEAWQKGGGAEQDLEPVPLSRRIFFALLIGVPLIGLAAGAVYLWRSGKTHQEERVIQDAIKEYEQVGSNEVTPAEAPVFAAVLQLAAGEWALREEGVDKAKALQTALTHFAKARDELRQAAPKDDSKRPTAAERSAVACELALATLSLGGTDEQVKEKTRIRWVPEAAANRPLRINEKVDTVHGELQRTLQLLQGADFDLKAALARRLTRELVKQGQAELAAGVPVMLFTEPEQPEAKAIVALEIFRADRGAVKARQIADELKAQLAGGAGGRNPTPAMAVTLWLVLGVEKPPPVVAPPPANPAQQMSDGTRLAYVGLYVLQDKPKEALDLAARSVGPAGQPGAAAAGQLRALALYAEWAPDPAPAFDLAVGIVTRPAKKGETQAIPLFTVYRLAQLAAAAGKAEPAKQLADSLADDGLKAWAKGEAVRLTATPENKAPREATAAELPDDPKKLRAGHAWACLWIVRHNVRLSGDKGKEMKMVNLWPKGAIHPFGTAGIALGLQDR